MLAKFSRRTKIRAAVALAAVAAAVGGALFASGASAEPSTRIVGGSVTTTDRFPYVMQITDASQSQFCGGTLVTPRKVVTAAHCVEDVVGHSGQIRVVGGRTYLDGTNGTVRRVNNIWVHPEWDSNALSSDVAVLTLREAMPYRPLPIAAATDTYLYEAGTMSRILGWGITSESSWESSNQLRTARVPMVSDAQCQEGYPIRYNSSTMVCAAQPGGGVDTCSGDSGGPLIIGGRLAGITSWGNGCARPNYPGIYTRVTTFSDEVTAQLS
jgi:secreted trypsin-like serine protease